MTRIHRISNLVGVILPPLGVLIAAILTWNTLVGPSDVAVFVVMYLLTGMGITVGYHRLFTHRSFQTSKPMRTAFAVLGSMAVQGPVISWVADHRKHHTFTDEEGDPHSPHTTHGTGIGAMFRGLWHAHMGWLFTEHGRADRRRYAADLVKDPSMRFVDRHFLTWVGISLLIPFLLGLGITGELAGGATALVWGGLVRIFLLHHVTWSINSVCHFFGTRRFQTEDESRNVFWLAPLSFGESWHHNHHAFPRSAFHGLRRWEFDPGGILIRALEKLRLVWDVERVPAEKQAERAAGQPASTAAA